MNSHIPNGDELERAKKLAQTDVGKELIRELSRQKSDAINAAVQRGDFGEVKKLVKEFLQTADAQELRKRTEE